MGSHRVAPPLVIRPQPSRRLAIHAALTHGLAFAVVAVLPLDLGLRIALLLAISLSATEVFLVKVLRRAPWAIRSAIWRSDGSWALTLVSGRTIEARLSPETFISLPLITLDFRLGRLQRRTLPLCSDSLDPDTLRQLRQRLRIEGAHPPSTPTRI